MHPPLFDRRYFSMAVKGACYLASFQFKLSSPWSVHMLHDTGGGPIDLRNSERRGPSVATRGKYRWHEGF